VARFVIDAPVAIRLVTDRQPVAAGHTLLAPALLRSQALALVYADVREGKTDERTARKILDGIRAMRMRLLGDRVLQGAAWDVARTLGWPDTYLAEYVALTQLHADAFVTLDKKLAKSASKLVRVAELTELL
jgi:predicted nucleic acid-binding protein